MARQRDRVVVLPVGLVFFVKYQRTEETSRTLPPLFNNPLLTVVAFLAIQRRAESLFPPFLGEDPRSGRHRRLMTHMLTVAAFEIRHPMILFIQVIADNSTNHDQSSSFHGQPYHKAFSSWAPLMKCSMQALIPAFIRRPLVVRMVDPSCLDSHS